MKTISKLGCVNVESDRKGFSSSGNLFLKSDSECERLYVQNEVFIMLFKLIQIINKVGVKEEFDKIQIENVTFKICFYFCCDIYFIIRSLLFYFFVEKKIFYVFTYITVRCGTYEKFDHFYTRI